MPIRPDLRPLYRTPEALAAFEACRARAAGKCERCGLAGGASISRRCPRCLDKPRLRDDCQSCYGAGRVPWKVILTVAHLNHDPRDNRPRNLACLCASCHLRHDAKQHAMERARGRDRRAGQLTLEGFAP